MSASRAPSGQIWLPVPSEIGDFGLVAGEAGLCGVVLPELGPSPRPVARLVRRRYPDAHRGSSPLLVLVAEFLRLYLAGGEPGFDGQLDYGNATPFEQVVWEATRSIPYGETRTYTWVAKAAGDPRAVRAVGQALGRNPLPVVVPCHRVLAADGSLGGFAAGPAMKKTLLGLEGITPRGSQTQLDLLDG
jgi:methylated-DNA-[protein]-cysteine S-methyltransferase